MRKVRVGGRSAKSKERKRDCCIADAKEGTWGWSGREGRRKERERRCWEPQEGVLRTTGKIF